MTPDELHEIRECLTRSAAAGPHPLHQHVRTLLAEVGHLTRELGRASADGWDQCAEHTWLHRDTLPDHPYTALLAANPHRGDPR